MKNTTTTTLNSINEAPKKINLSLAAARELYPTQIKNILKTKEKSIHWEVLKNIKQITDEYNLAKLLERFKTNTRTLTNNINDIPINNTVILWNKAA